MIEIEVSKPQKVAALPVLSANFGHIGLGSPAAVAYHLVLKPNTLWLFGGGVLRGFFER